LAAALHPESLEELIALPRLRPAAGFKRREREGRTGKGDGRGACSK